MNTLLDDMFDSIFATNLYRPIAKNKINNVGFKDVIHRPHNLYAIKDEEGNVTSYKIELTTTPFKKEDVKIKILNDIMTVSCGTEDFIEPDNEHMVYHGISSQTYQFSLKLNGIDQNKITAKVEDGILTIVLPTLKREEPKAVDIAIM